MFTIQNGEKRRSDLRFQKSPFCCQTLNTVVITEVYSKPPFRGSKRRKTEFLMCCQTHTYLSQEQYGNAELQSIFSLQEFQIHDSTLAFAAETVEEADLMRKIGYRQAVGSLHIFVLENSTRYCPRSAASRTIVRKSWQKTLGCN